MIYRYIDLFKKGIFIVAVACSKTRKGKTELCCNVTLMRLILNAIFFYSFILRMKYAHPAPVEKTRRHAL